MFIHKFHGFIVVILFILLTTQTTSACYAIAAGKNATKDGSVLLGHDEQNGGTCIVNFRYIPRRQFNSGDMVALKRGGKLPQVNETYAFLWSQNVKLEWSDGYMNEYGVSVTSDMCPSAEKKPQLTDGGIGYLLRRLVVERARTAREGVHIAGDFIHQFGYAAPSGRTLLIADPNEIWVLAMVPGKHWVAQRVPDDMAIAIPNTYIIREINLKDTSNFIGSPDLIDYAKQKGWYKSGTFIFTDVYGVKYTDSEYKRQWNGQKALTENVVPYGEIMPFAVKPDKKLTVEDVLSILRDHDNSSTQEGSVYQLRSDMPKEIGCIYWRTTAQPRYSGLTQWYAGITATPASYCKDIDLTKQLTLDYHFNPPSGTFKNDPKFVWWDFKGIQDKVSGSSLGYKRVRSVWDEWEKRLYKNQQVVESIAQKLFKENKDSAIGYITEYSNHIAYKASLLADKMNKSWINNSNNTYCVALATAAPVKALQAIDVKFDCFGCSNNAITTYTWDFGDGQSGSGASIAHSYKNVGTYTAIATIKDDNGNVAKDSINIVVEKNNTNLNSLKTNKFSKDQMSLYIEPFMRSIFINFTANNLISNAQIRINTLSGKLIKVFDILHQRNGLICWKGKNSQGHFVSPGVYVIDIVGNGLIYDSKKVILH